MCIRKFLALLLSVNIAAAIVSGWQTANKILVICNALALLCLIARKAITKED